MSTIGLSPPAAYVLRSLHDHPALRLPDAIAAGPDSDGTFDARAVQDGLDELQARGLAEDEPGRGWRVTPGAAGT
jgi:hypothetical protein